MALPYMNWLSAKYPLCILPHIVKLSTTSVTTGAASVTYTICPCKWKQLSKEGLILLQINHTPATGSDAFLVSIATSPVDTTTNTTTTARPLLNGAGEQLTSADVTIGNRYLVYFNKCDGTFQIVNYIPATTA